MKRRESRRSVEVPETHHVPPIAHLPRANLETKCVGFRKVMSCRCVTDHSVVVRVVAKVGRSVTHTSSRMGIWTCLLRARAGLWIACWMLQLVWFVILLRVPTAIFRGAPGRL